MDHRTFAYGDFCGIRTGGTDHIVRDVAVTGCAVENNRGAGTWFDAGYGNIVVADNLVKRNDGGGAYQISHPAGPDTFGIKIVNNRLVENYA